MNALMGLLSAGVITLFFVAVPLTVDAQSYLTGVNPTGIVPCGDPGEPSCTVCHVGNLVQELVRFAVYAAVFIATLVIAYAGFRMIMAQGDTGAVTEAKRILVSAVWGFVIVLSAWLIVDTLMKVLFNKGQLGPWNDLGQCVSAKPTPTSTSAPTSPSVTQPGLAIVPKSPYEPRLEAWDPNIPIKPAGACSAQRCQVDSTLSDRLFQFKNELDVRGLSETSWWVTEAYPPTIKHLNQCHSEGTCVDANFRSTSFATADNIKIMQAAAQRSDLRAVYEVRSESRRNELVQAGVAPADIQIVTTINGEHFSVYVR